MIATTRHREEQIRHVIILVTAFMLLWYLLPCGVVLANYFAGYTSEKLIARQGTNNSLLVIGRGLPDSRLEVALGPRVATVAATNIYRDALGNHATLNGNLASLGLAANTTVYFEWGYNTSYGNVTAPQVLVVPVAFNAAVNNFTPQPVHFRGVAINDDGITYGADSEFTLPPEAATTPNILIWVVAVFGVVGLVLILLGIAGNLNMGTVIVAIIIGILLSIALPMLISIISSTW